jgi:mannose-6-phosphate isomerase-like protein (cupin superfamily)
MIIRRESMKKENRPAMRGGPGAVDLVNLTGAPCKNCRLLAEVIIPPGAGIGVHEHVNETEYYIITGGAGIVTDNGKEVPVKAGEVVETGGGASHAIRNSGSVPLTMLAVIITC